MSFLKSAMSKALKSMLGAQLNQDAPGNYMGPGNQQFGTSALSPVAMAQTENPLEKKRQEAGPIRMRIASMMGRGL